MVGRLAFAIVAIAALAAASAAAGGDPRAPKKHLNRADQEWARRILIKRADLGSGDWRVEQSKDEGDADAPPACKNPNFSDLVLTGEAENPDFSRNGSYVDSGVEVWASERDAAVAWKRGSHYPFEKCFAAAAKQEFEKNSNIKFIPVSSGPLRIGKLAPRMLTYGLRFSMKLPSARIDGRLDMYFFSRGRADASLMVLSLGKPARPIPISLERRLADLVARRLHR